MLQELFESRIFSQVLLDVLLKSNDVAVTTCLRYMYSNLKTGIKDGSQLFPILKGERQGALTSSVLFNKCATGAKNKLNISFIFLVLLCPFLGFQPNLFVMFINKIIMMIYMGTLDYKRHWIFFFILDIVIANSLQTRRAVIRSTIFLDDKNSNLHYNWKYIIFYIHIMGNWKRGKPHYNQGT